MESMTVLHHENGCTYIKLPDILGLLLHCIDEEISNNTTHICTCLCFDIPKLIELNLI